MVEDSPDKAVEIGLDSGFRTDSAAVGADTGMADYFEVDIDSAVGTGSAADIDFEVDTGFVVSIDLGIEKDQPLGSL